jgi:hypothetical protein
MKMRPNHDATSDGLICRDRKRQHAAVPTAPRANGHVQGPGKSWVMSSSRLHVVLIGVPGMDAAIWIACTT